MNEQSTFEEKHRTKQGYHIEVLQGVDVKDF